MILIIGLGNPGDEYTTTRHNIGRTVISALQKKLGFADFSFDKKYNTQISDGKIGKEKIILAMPETFVNDSGKSVAPLARFFKVKPENIFVVHDDADIAFGSAKLSFGKRSAGHKGVESIIKALKSMEFWRFRIGIGDKKDTPAKQTVLKKFTPAQTEVLKKIIKSTVDAIEEAVEKNPQVAMNSYNSQ